MAYKDCIHHKQHKVKTKRTWLMKAPRATKIIKIITASRTDKK